MTEFGVSNKYADELMALIQLLPSPQQMMLYQILVPKNIVDDIGYLSWATGIPAHQDTINWVRNNVKSKKYRTKKDTSGKTKVAALWALEDLQSKFKKEQEKNPLFKEIIEGIEQGDYSLNSYLRMYCNKPESLPNMDWMQARLIFSNEGLLDPNSGIKMIRYSMVARKNVEKYAKALHAIFQRMVAEKKSAKPAQ